MNDELLYEIDRLIIELVDVISEYNDAEKPAEYSDMIISVRDYIENKLEV